MKPRSGYAGGIPPLPPSSGIGASTCRSGDAAAPGALRSLGL
jgi:hypothetical protein